MMDNKELKERFCKCQYAVMGQCMEQAGDNEDLTLEEFKDMLPTCKYPTVCPFSQYHKGAIA